MIKRQNVSLKDYNTFGLDVKAETFIEVNKENELISFLQTNSQNNLALILGGGSNMLLTKDIDGIVLHVNISGKSIIEENERHAIVEVNAGENWHELVLWAIENNLGGIENLSLIPGNTGTAPMQNIGAYGVELKDVFESLDAIEIATGKKKSFSKSDCNFGYRESIFKNIARGKFIITAVRFKLNKAPHSVSTQYGAIQIELKNSGISNPSIKDVSNAVIAIRQSKLPDPKQIGNSGSFFKNPIITADLANELKSKHEDLPVYPVTENKTKIAAGWLIERSGWKGFRRGDAGVHKKQALVLVNYGNARGQELLDLAHEIIADVNNKFGIILEPEVNVI